MRNKILESSLSKVFGYNSNYDCGALTAFRDNYTNSENYQRNRKLKAQLVSSDFIVISGKGKFIEKGKDGEDIPVWEDSFFIVDKNNTGELRNLIISLGEEWEQDSILYMPKGMMNNEVKAEIIGTSKEENAEPKYKEVMYLDSSKFGKEGKYFSSFINGRPYYLESFNILQKPRTNMGRWSLKLMLEKHWSDKSWLC